MTFRSLLDRLFPRQENSGEPAPENPWIVMGIGNPGAEYRDTRHNAGHWCVQRLVAETGATLENRRLARTGHVEIEGHAVGPVGRLALRVGTGHVEIEGHAVVLALARTYVNLSGEAADYLLTRYRADPGRLIVVTDDINLSLGVVRIRKQGSAGGHKGLRSVIEAIGTDKFIRVRIGIGKPASPDKQVEHVLGVPGPDERAVLDETVERAAEAVKTIIGEGVEISMNRYNSMAPAEGAVSDSGPGDKTRG